MSENTDRSRQQAIERIRQERALRRDLDQLYHELIKGKRDALSKAITLIESSHPDDRSEAAELLSRTIDHSGNSWRIGITGVPGVGKSTFIESFGNALIEAGHKVAVLAIDPSSQRSHGSILGDKTRMETLSRNPNAFVRPSPAADALGGVARATRESIILCEAAGFDVILVETVGVGQSEITVHGMVDFFLLLMLAGAGDELQGIKRGIMEMADALLITKADGENLKAASNAMRQYKAALHLYPPSEKDWHTPVAVCSAAAHAGINEFLEVLTRYFMHVSASGWKESNRKTQDLTWFDEALSSAILLELKRDPLIKERMKDLRTRVSERKISPFVAAHELIESWRSGS